MSFDIAFNPPQFDDEYDRVKMNQLVEEIERLHSILTSDTDDEGVLGSLGDIDTGDITIWDTTNTYSSTLSQVASGWLEFQPNVASRGFGTYFRETNILGVFAETGGASSPPVVTDSPSAAVFFLGEPNADFLGYFGFSLSTNMLVENDIPGGGLAFGVTPTAGSATIAGRFYADDKFFSLENGWGLRITDALETDWAEFSHDGADFNTDFTNTANWNVNDIAVFNLRDSLLRLTDVGNSTLANYSLVNDALGFSGTGVTQFNISGLGSLRLLGSTTLDIREGSSFTMRGSTVGNNVAFSHDNTDFNTNFVNTANWNITNLTQMVFPIGTAGFPTIAFGNGASGFYSSTANNISFVTQSLRKFLIDTTSFRSDSSTGVYLLQGGSQATIPSLCPRSNDTDTGHGSGAADQLSSIAGGVEAIRYSEASSHVIADSEVHAGITAGTTQTQAGGFQLLSSHNEVSTVATANDTVVAPLAVSGRVLTILNNGANTLKIFPAVGDDIGAGVDAAITLVAGGKLWFVAYDATTWTLFSQSGANQYAAPTAAFGLTNASGVQSALPAAIDTFTLLPNSTYEFEGTYIFATGTTSKTIALAFALTGAVVTNINYTTVAWNGTAGALSTTQRTKRTNTVASTVVTQANTSAAVVVTFRGIMRVTTGGTVVPQINFSAAPGGTNQMGVGSYVKFSRLGSDTDQTTGGWA